MRESRERRAGFTLIEMLVVIGLILVLAALVLTVNLRTADQRRVIRAADQLQGWLLIAKQRAIHDRAIRGIVIDSTGTQLQYVEQPEPWTQAQLTNVTGVPAVISVPTWDRDLVSLLPATDPRSLANMSDWRNFVFLSTGGNLFQVGDTLEFLEPPSVHQIQAIFGPGPGAMPPPTGPFSWYSQSIPPYPTFPSPPSNPQPGTAPLIWMLQLGTPVPGSASSPVSTSSPAASWQLSLWPTTNFRITRRPQPMVGEALLQMPKDTAILAGAPVGAPATSGSSFSGTSLPLPATILFGPDGRLVGSTGNVVLWVQDNAGVAEPTLIVIYSRTGLIAAHPVDQSSGNPYSFTLDGQSSGM